MPVIILLAKTKCKSFTLIELTVTIGISVLLIAMSYPIFSRERRENIQGDADLTSTMISKTRNYAYHPENADATDYVFAVVPGKTVEILRQSAAGSVTIEQVDLSKASIAALDYSQVSFSVETKLASFNSPVSTTDEARKAGEARFLVGRGSENYIVSTSNAGGANVAKTVTPTPNP